MHKNPLLAGMFLVCGTSIGTGILGIPTITAEAGFVYSVAIFILCWGFTTITSLYMLESYLWLKGDVNLISMAHVLLGPIGKIITWVLYLLLLYSLICAYLLVGSSWLIKFFTESFNIIISKSIGLFIFSVTFGGIVYLGTRSIEKINRYLTIAFLITLSILIITLFPSVDEQRIGLGDIKKTLVTLPLLITAFGYSMIIPSLGTYFNHHVKPLMLSVIFGSLIALVSYFAWEYVSLGVIPLEGPLGLLDLAKNHDDGTGVIRGLEQVAQSFFPLIISFFAVCAVTTSFLGVSMSLFHFLSDGLKAKERRINKVSLFVLMYLPPFLIIAFYPAGFHQILSWAGVFVAVLFGIIPSIMVFIGRYKLNFQGFKVIGGKSLIVIAIIFFLFVAVQQFLL